MTALREALERVEARVRAERARATGGVSEAAARPEPMDVPEPEDLAGWIERAGSVLRGLEAPSLQREWRRLDARLAAGRFTVVVLGDQGRGKTTVIHRLLGEPVLPEGPSAPAIPCPVRLEYGPASFLERVAATGERSHMPLNAESWSRIGSGEPPELVRVELPDRWLRAVDLRLVELPPPGAWREDGADQARCLDELALADGALLVVNATAALGLTEKQLFERYVLGPNVPYRAVVLTRLDGVDGAERPELLDYVRRKVAAWGGPVPVAALGDGTRVDLASDGCLTGVDALRALLDSWIGEDAPTRERRVEGQLRARLAVFFAQAREALVAEEEASRMSVEERRRWLGAERRALDRRGGGWTRIVVELGRRRDRRLLEISRFLDEQREATIRNLGLSLKRETDLQNWWNEILPDLWRRELERLTAQLERTLQQQISRDIRWLAHEAEQQLSSRLELGDRSSTRLGAETTAEARRPSERDDLPSFRTRRLAVRAGSVVLAVASVAWVGPGAFGLYGLLSVLPGVVAEPVMSRSLRHRRRSLRGDLEREVTAAFRCLAEQVRSRVEEIYERIEETVEREARQWRRRRIAALRNARPERPERCRELRCRIEELDRWQSLLEASAERITNWTPTEEDRP